MITRQEFGARLRRFPAISIRQFKIAGACLLALIVAGLLYEYSLLQSSRRAATPAVAEADSQLKVVTRVSLNTYYEGENGPSGFEYTLLKLFANHLDKELIVYTADTLNQLFKLVATNEVVLASAALSPTQSRKASFTFSDAYLTDQAVVVYKAGNKRPRKVADMAGHDLVVIANSSHAAALARLKSQHPELSWRELEDANFVDLLSRIERGEIDYTIIDSSEFALHQGSFPSIKRAFHFGEEQSFNWMFAKNAGGETLRLKADQFLATLRENGTLARLEEQFFGQSANISQSAANEFAKNVRARLPQYIDRIKNIADEHKMDWRLLAAISYQESGWNPKAKSPTGVRGMMMLTLPTARELGISNRLDAEQSLSGGALYYQNLKNRLPERIREPDRSWLALAAYNVGFGHLEDARRITQSRGDDPDSWFHVKRSLPLLSDPDWHKATRYGYARGHEPVRYVQQVRHYYNVLLWSDLTDIELTDNNGAEQRKSYVGVSRDTTDPLVQLVNTTNSTVESDWVSANASAEQLIEQALSEKEQPDTDATAKTIENSTQASNEFNDDAVVDYSPATNTERHNASQPDLTSAI